MMAEKKSTDIRPPSYLDALIPIVVLIVLLASAVYLYGADPGRPAGYQDWAPQT